MGEKTDAENAATPPEKKPAAQSADKPPTPPAGKPSTPSAPPKNIPLIRWQRPMIVVLIAAAPAAMSAVYRFGWRAMAVIAVTALTAFVAEWLFTRARKEPVSSAVFVTAVLLALTLPPTIPYWIAAVGAVVAICFGKELFGGFGRNIFNPALVGRCFIYICFPVAMTGRWAQAAAGPSGGFALWATKTIDAVTAATPLDKWRLNADLTPYADLLLGNRTGSLGETMAVAILIGAAILLFTRVADWHIMLSCVLGALALGGIFKLAGLPGAPNPLWTVLAGGFLFGAVFMVTDPVSASRTPAGKWIYGALAGMLTVVMRRFGIFPEGMMFAILLGNTFIPAIDIGVRGVMASRKKPEPAPGKEAAA